MSPRKAVRTSWSHVTLVSPLLFVFAIAGCATTHEEPPAPPPPPIDPAAFSGPLRPPAAAVDVSADLDGSVIWADATPVAEESPSALPEAGSDAQAKAKIATH